MRRDYRRLRLYRGRALYHRVWPLSQCPADFRHIAAHLALGIRQASFPLPAVHPYEALLLSLGLRAVDPPLDVRHLREEVRHELACFLIADAERLRQRPRPHAVKHRKHDYLHRLTFRRAVAAFFVWLAVELACHRRVNV